MLLLTMSRTTSPLRPSEIGVGRAMRIAVFEATLNVSGSSRKLETKIRERNVVTLPAARITPVLSPRSLW